MLMNDIKINGSDLGLITLPKASGVGFIHTQTFKITNLFKFAADIKFNISHNY